MSDNKILTDDQYHILLEGEHYFEEYSKVQYCRSIEPRFISRMQQVYQDFYNSPLNINCQSCLGQGLTKLWHHMNVKKGQIEEAREGSVNIVKHDEKLKQDETIRPKKAK